MKRLYQNAFRKLMAAGMAVGMVLGSAGMAGAESAASKEETVYIFTDASGNQTKVLVSDWLKNSDNASEIKDATTLKDVTNVKGDETYSQGSGDEIIWNSDGNDIYYQGTTDKETPVSVKITYTLDGKEISPEELAGKSGKVVIRYDYTNNETVTAKVGDEEEEINVPFTVLSGMLFSDNCVSNVEVNTGKVITEGDKTIVVGLAFPGLQDSLKLDEAKDQVDDKLEENDSDIDLDLDIDIPDYVEVTMDAENFAMDMSMSLVMNNLLDELDIDDKGVLDDLKGSMDELTDAAQKLVDGTDELAEGIGELYDKTPELKDGVQELKDGIVEYTDGVSSVSDGVGQLKSGSGDLADGAVTLASGAHTLSGGAGNLADGAHTLSGGASQLSGGASALATGADDLKSGAKELKTGANELKTGVNT